MSEDRRPRIGAATLIEHEGKFLLGLRNKKNYNNKWVIPGGGVEWGETLEDAAIREIKEETNLDVKLIKMIGYREIINLPGDYHSIVFFFFAKPKSVDLVSRDDISQARFFTIEEIKRLDIAESVEWAFRELGIWNNHSMKL